MIWANEDAIAAIKELGQVMRLNENAVAAIKATGISMSDFKVRQEFTDSLKKNYGSSWIEADQLLYENNRAENHQKYVDKIIEMVHESALNKLLGATVHQKVLPVTMEINGERVKVGEAIVDSRDGGFCVVHAVIDGQHNVAQLLKTDLAQISIGNRDDFKTERKPLQFGDDGHLTESKKGS